MDLRDRLDRVCVQIGGFLAEQERYVVYALVLLALGGVAGWLARGCVK